MNCCTLITAKIWSWMGHFLSFICLVSEVLLEKCWQANEIIYHELGVQVDWKRSWNYLLQWGNKKQE